MANLSAYPSYYAHMAPINLTGPRARRPGPAGAARRRRAGRPAGQRRMGGGSAPPHAVRQQPPEGRRELRIRLRDQLQLLPRLGASLGREADARGQPGGPAKRHPGPLPHRHRPAGRRRRNRPRSPGAGRPGGLLSPRTGWAAVVHEKPAEDTVLDVRRADEFADIPRGRCGERAAARTAGPARRAAGGADLGALRLRIPCRGGRQPPAAGRPGRGADRRPVPRGRARRGAAARGRSS